LDHFTVISKFKRFVLLAGVTVGQSSNDPISDMWDAYQSQRVGGSNMMQTMLGFYILNSDFAGTIDAAEVLASGCWCHLDQLNKIGSASDKIDSHCKNWSRCHECIGIDSSQCDANEQSYNVDISSNFQTFACSSSNSGCQMNACQCDVHLINQIFVDLNSWNHQNAILNGFSLVDNCLPKAHHGLNQSPLSCCGDYPTRFPYRTKNGKRGCCSGKTYDTTVLSCCLDGEMRPIGTCQGCDCINGSCDGSTIGGSCLCDPGWAGSKCDLELCTDNCINSGTAQSQPASSPGESCLCTCSAGYSGSICENDPCSSTPCNNGSCSVTGSTYSCQCNMYWTGSQCDIYNPPSPCASDPCQQGACTDVDNYNYICVCNQYWAGPHCEIFDPCSTNPCLSGTCSDDGTSYTCTCDPYWTGTNCDVYDPPTPCELDPCQYGTCSEIGSTYICTCDQNWTGQNCDVFDPCATNTCSTYETCLVVGQSYECHCSPGWQGADCTKQCDVTLPGRIDITVVMDVSGSIASNPQKDEYTFAFFTDLLAQFEADTQVKLSIISFSNSAVVNLPLDFYTPQEVDTAISNIAWVGQGTNITAGLEAATGQIDTSDNVNDIMVVMSDGFDSYSIGDVIGQANALVNAGVSTISIAFGLNNFYSSFVLEAIANYVTPNVFTAGSGQAVESLVDGVFDSICSQTPSRRTVSLSDTINWNDPAIFLTPAAGRYLDKYGKLPAWAEILLKR